MTVPATFGDTDETFDQHCIVEMLGHRRLAGRVREVQVAGAGFLRVDIPAAGDDPGRTQFISPASIYALHPVDEATARQAAAVWRPQPVQRWELPAIERDDDAERAWAEEGMATATDPDPDYGRDLDDEDDHGDEVDDEGPF